MTLILFDLGDTLFFREQTIEEYDIKMLQSCFLDRKAEDIVEVVSIANNVFPEINNHRLASFLFSDLEIESERQKAYYSYILDNLKENYSVEKLLTRRYMESPYKLFAGVVDILKGFKYEGLVMGVATNGRPSRRLILEGLGISSYFDNNYYFISDEMKVHKPENSFYQIVFEKSTEFEEIILVDDDYKNVKAFNDFGGKGILIKGTEIYKLNKSLTNLINKLK